MAAYMPLVQQLLSGFATQLGGPAANISASATSAEATATATPLTMPTDLSSLLTLLLSFSALRDWMKLAVLGGMIEICRRFVFGGYNKLINSFFITACFEEQDMSYEWMMVWLSKQPSWSKARDVQISTNSLANNVAIFLDGEDDTSERFKSSRKLAYLPSLSTTYNLWYKGRWMTITRVQNQTGWYGSKEQTLYVSIMTRDHRILSSLLQEARRDYLAAQVHKMCVYVSDTSNNWRHVACREKRSMDSIVLDPGVKNILVDDAKDFLLSKEWYAERGIPFRRGYLLYGAPGSGKTSFIHSVAGELGLDVYIISLSRIGLDDSALGELVNALPERCVALMEDIDAAFTSGLNRDTTAPTVDSQDINAKPVPGAPPPPPTMSRLSLSGLLNALDGVGAQEGRILFATTNKYSALDAALCRPGRMDLHIEFKLASKFQARQLFSRFYLPAHNPDTMLADDKEDAAEEEGSEKGSVDSGYNSTAGDEVDEKEPPSPVESIASTDVPESEKPTYNGTSHQTRAPKLKRRQIAELAVRFAESIPEREISMASLQGFLMSYKTRPFEAVAEADAWVEKERTEKAAKERKEKEAEAEKAKAAALAKEKAKEVAAEKESDKQTAKT
ncbi:P-loop containing nucleoside triphosphate hydrolase protein [Mycena maculata]|uniref:P-loop containing nucleoside triphosphate hydrolase protein n=1 Tax=Mycena maculata TaxID=230809 RepID=A0AAD7N8L8_9AGAR|nr:P-loop containing nucleoside triphosphate hydrolase protein [Mycena maculata]